MSDQKQSKVEAGSAAAKAVASADSDIDRLISEFDTAKTGETDTADRSNFQAVKPLLDAIKPIATFAQAKMQEERQAAEKKSVGEAVSFVKTADSLKEVPDRLVKGYLQDRYVEESEFRDAYDNRADKPKAWQAQLEKAQADFVEDFKSISTKSLRSDVEAAKAAVKGVVKGAVEKTDDDPAKLFNMSDVEFRNYKQGLSLGSRS